MRHFSIVMEPAVDRADGYSLDGGEPCREGSRREAYGTGQSESGKDVDAEDKRALGAGGDPQRGLKPRDELGEEGALVGLRLAHEARAIGASRGTGHAIGIAPTEMPAGESGQPFPSATTRSAGYK